MRRRRSRRSGRGAYDPAEARALIGRQDIALIDLRARGERDRHGIIPGSLHTPYPDLQENIEPGGVLRELAASTGQRLLFYCAFGERSAMAVRAAQDAGFSSARHIEGGTGAWKNAGRGLRAVGIALRRSPPVSSPAGRCR